MQSRFSRILAVFLSVIVFLSSFAANPLSKSITFLEARYVPGTGIVLLFQASGLKQSDLRGATIYVHSNDYDMSCNFKDGDKKDETRTVRCVVSGGLSEWAGESFTASLAGFSFNGIIPAEKNSVAACPEGEELWLLLRIFDEEGEFFAPVPAKYLSFVAALIQQEGLDYEIVDQACFPIEESELPEPG